MLYWNYKKLFHMIDFYKSAKAGSTNEVLCTQARDECLRPVGLENAAYLAALLHDIGKFTAAFQQYLAAGDRSARGRVIHSFQGCRYLLEQFQHETDSVRSIMASELLAFAVGAHHGLFDCVDSARRDGLKYRSEMQGISYEESVAGFFSQEISQQETERLFSAAMAEIDQIIERLEESYADDQEYFFCFDCWRVCSFPL